MIHVNLNLSEILFKKNHCNLFYVILIVFAVSIPLQSFGHGGEEGLDTEIIILSRFVDGNIDVSADSKQWTESFDKDFDSKWGHDISVKSLNNGTNVYFLLSWDDTTKGDDTVNDGAMITFESKSDNTKENEKIEDKVKDKINEVWSWNTDKFSDSTDIIIKHTWENQQWHVLFGRSVSTLEQDKISFETGIKQEGFIKIVVWNGANGESVEKINIDELQHADFILLPKIETYPKDVFVWSSFLIGGAVSFLFVERKLHYKKEMSLNE